MEGLACILGAILLYVVPMIIRAVEGAGQQRKLDKMVRQARDSGLSIRCKNDLLTADDGDQLPVVRVEISGAILVPSDNLDVMMRVWLLDVTDGDDDLHPVFCMIPDLADDDGLYTFDQRTTIPYQFSEVSGMEVAVIPTSALLLPKKGQRRLRVCVAITQVNDAEGVYAFGNTVIAHTQESAGYLEFKDRDIKQERCLAMLAFSLSAVDGHIDRRETAVIRRFFAEHLAGRTDEDERKTKVDETLKRTFSDFKKGTEKPAALIKRLCSEIREDNDASLAQAAYELCVQVAASDEVLEESEKRGLKYIAQQLELPDEFVREIHDRNFRLSMYSKADDEALVDMPKGLSHDEKIEFLNQEYRKWRSRAAHKDPAVATEANVRLQQITRARRELQEA